MEQPLLLGHVMNRPPIPRSSASRSSVRGSNERGFTLVELLVVMGIIAIMAAVSLPNITGYLRSSKIRTAQDQVFTAIQKARGRAITLNTQWGVSFVMESRNVYWIHIEDPQIATATQVAQTGRQPLNSMAPDPGLSTRYEMDSQVRFAVAPGSCPAGPGGGNQASLRFDRYGSRAFPGFVPPPPDVAIPALGLAGGTVTTNGILTTTAQADATICLVDSATGLFRLITIGAGGRVKKG